MAIFPDLNAQGELEDLSIPALKKRATGAMRYGDPHTAIACYEEILHRQENKESALLKLMSLYERVRDYNSALNIVEKRIELTNNSEPQLIFKKGEFLKQIGRYQEAQKSYEEYIELIKRDQSMRDWRKRAKAASEGCDSALVMIENQINVEIDRLSSSVNGPHIEFNPILYYDELLIYGALKEDSIRSYGIDSTKPNRKFFYAQKSDEYWQEIGVWNEDLIEEGVDIGNGAFNSDTTRFYFSKCGKNWKNEIHCTLWVGDVLSSGRIVNTRKLDELINLPGSSNSQPALGKESRKGYDVLYFVSDREGGRGGKDIWAAVFDERKKRFKSPRNIGRKINSEYDELSPHYNLKQHKLFYSSNKPEGIGGFDIYSSRGEYRKWAEAKNIGYPLNTNSDELYFTTTSDASKGYFTSNRTGTAQIFHPNCCDDIFRYHFRDYVNIHLKGKIVEVADSLFVKGVEALKTDLEEFNPLKNARVKLFIKEDGEEIFMQTIDIAKNGYYELDLEAEKEYRLEASKEGYLSNFYELSTIGQTFSDTSEVNLGLTKVESGPIRIPNIYYDFNSAALTVEAQSSLRNTLLKILNDNPGLKIEIGSHTDSKGNDDYNLNLSQERAQSVVNFLIANGIDKVRLEAKGYGESMPIAPNVNSDGSDNPEGRQKNRRTEFTILSNIVPNIIIGEED